MIVPFKSGQRISKLFFMTLLWADLLHGVLPTAESDLAESCPPRSLTRQCPAHRKVWLGGVLSTAESDLAESCQPFLSRSLGPELSIHTTSLKSL